MPRIIDHFGILAPVYDRTIPFSRLEQMVRICNLPVNGMLLDAAGGTGRVAEALKPFVTKLIVADYSRGMLLQAVEKGLPCLQTPLELLPFSEGIFDRIIMVDALHHVYHQDQTLAELWRVLKIGGYFIIEEPDIRTWRVKGLALIEKIALMRSHFLSPFQISELLPSEAQINFDTDGFNAWLIIKKKLPGSDVSLPGNFLVKC